MEDVLSTEDYGLKAPIGPRRRRSMTAFREGLARRRSSAFFRARFSVLAALSDACAIVVSAIVVGVLYHGLYYHVSGMAGLFTAVGASTAILFVTFNVLRQEYELPVYLEVAGHARRVLTVWSITFLFALIFLFLTKRSAEYSRASVLLLYLLAAVLIVATRLSIVAKIRASAIAGRISALRVILVGREQEISDFSSRYTPSSFGIDVAASFVLRGTDSLQDDIALAAASARVLRPDDIFILLPWSETKAIEACVAAFVTVPASIHLGPQDVLDRFSNVTVARIGKIYSLHLVRRPLTAVDIATKRVFDIAIGLPLLIGLLPLLLLVAIAIKLDSRGPVLFLQRRYGFNQETFRIVKFRSMHVVEDGARVTQAVRDDPRVTRLGRLMRRYNIDELPQLLNVLRGEMSLVGPRPHALVHDQKFARTIAEYARRHNVKPGITGWAQVHGLRGEITSDEMMRQRVQHDLFYIDNWTVAFDLRILLMTLASRRVFENAY